MSRRDYIRRVMPIGERRHAVVHAVHAQCGPGRPFPTCMLPIRWLASPACLRRAPACLRAEDQAGLRLTGLWPTAFAPSAPQGLLVLQAWPCRACPSGQHSDNRGCAPPAFCPRASSVRFHQLLHASCEHTPTRRSPLRRQPVAVQLRLPLPFRVLHPNDQVPHARPGVCVRRVPGHREVLAGKVMRVIVHVASRCCCHHCCCCGRCCCCCCCCWWWW